MIDLHFIRPLWLLALIPAIAMPILLTRRQDSRRIWHRVVAEPLLQYLLTQQAGDTRLRPQVLLGVILSLISLALAGPTWVREPAPFADDIAALVIAVEVTPTMLAQDLQPSRLARAAHKIKDLVARRSGAATALVAYAGSAHLVMPLTEDGELIAEFAGHLAPRIMPAEGDAAELAVEIARGQLIQSRRAGSVLLVTDSVSPNSIVRIKNSQQTGTPRVHVYGMAAGPEAVVPPSGPPAPPLDRDNLETAASAGSGSLIVVTPDSRDIDRLSRIVETQITAATDPQGGDRWRDFGYWLIPVIAFLSLWWFRPGWTIRWQPVSILLVLVFVLVLAKPALFSADVNQTDREGERGRLWFQTADQKAQRLINQNQFAEAAELFSTPSRQGTAWYRAGNFKRAAAAFGRTGTPEGAYNRGNALVMMGDYETAISSYSQALQERPDWEAAAANLQVARARLAKLAPPEDAVSQKGVGEDDEPDEIVFDDRAKDRPDANTETVAGAGTELNDEALRALWLRRIQTKPEDFLRHKFAYQYAHQQQSGSDQ